MVFNVKLRGEKQLADVEGADGCLLEFEEIVQDDSSCPEQIYDADETSLYWRMLNGYIDSSG